MNRAMLRLNLILIVLVSLFQNCTPPDVTSGVVASGKGSAGSASTLPQPLGPTSVTQLTATYAPKVVSINSQVVVTAAGGLAPYSYLKITGIGSLQGNVYSTTAASESVVLAAKDSAGVLVYVYITVGSGGSTVVAPPAPTTPAQLPSTNQATTLPNGKQVGRTCDLATLAAFAQGGDDDRAVRGTVRYLICLALGREATPEESQYYAGLIEDNDGFDPLTIAQTYFFSNDGSLRYSYGSMSNSDFALLVVRVLLRREPTSIELAASVAQLNSGTSRQDYFYGVEAKYLVVEDSFLAAMTAKLKAAQSN